MATHQTRVFGGGRRAARHRAAGHGGLGRQGTVGPRRPPWLGMLLVIALVVAALTGWRVLADRAADTAGGPTTDAGAGSDVGGTGLRSVVRVGDAGALHSVMRLTFRSPRSRITLSIPRRSGTTGQFAPKIRSLRVQADSFQRRIPGTLSVGDSRVVRLPRRSGAVQVEYSATGATAWSRPAPPGRALVLVTPLAVPQAGGLSWRLQIAAPRVLNLGCVTAAGALDSCGTRSGRRWTATGGRGVRDVVAQVDLPTRPGPAARSKAGRSRAVATGRSGGGQVVWISNRSPERRAP